LQKAERSMGEKFSQLNMKRMPLKTKNSTLELQNRNLVYALSFLTILGYLYSKTKLK
jgi:hypothetical protein